ncbi:hypothetical protein DPMN_157775 [Dreissena polymorpha]|uniref:C1q domain-containing protein n=1 Tax=Dreissena polymorpha TaxID=45954 RepID=A0A9D4EK36_DREPO|nr:hypothetical protein DPMN_157775 [Dreissena polymorpha]
MSGRGDELDDQFIFPTIILNLGNDYNPYTGVFTCRVPGLYFFSVSLTKRRVNSRSIDLVDAYIKKNGMYGIILASTKSDPYDKAEYDYGSYMIGTSCTVHLRRGETIIVTGYHSSFFDGDKCSFTGFLITADIL